MLEVVLLQHILCGAQIVYGTVSETVCKIFWHLNLSGSGSPGTQVKRRQWRKLMQNHREVSRWSGDPDLQSHFAFLLSM